MDASLYPTLRAGILAQTDPEFVALRQAGSTGLMSEWLNKPHASELAWNKAAPWGPMFDQIDGALYTPTPTNVSNAADPLATKLLLVNLCKLTLQQNMLLANPTVDARTEGTRNAILDTVTGVYTLSGTNRNNPGGANGAAVAAKMARPATRGEVIFGGATAQAGGVTARVLAYEGSITDNDVVQAVNLP